MHLIEVNVLRTLEVQRTQFACGELLDFEGEGVCRGWEFAVAPQSLLRRSPLMGAAHASLLASLRIDPQFIPIADDFNLPVGAGGKSARLRQRILAKIRRAQRH